eukprot:3526495-Prymnesium_polylepis.1
MCRGAERIPPPPLRIHPSRVSCAPDRSRPPARRVAWACSRPSSWLSAPVLAPAPRPRPHRRRRRRR